MSFTARNHYVPKWHQRRFLISGDGEAKFFYLDVKPDVVVSRNGRSHLRRSILRWGPKKCFKEDHLYTTRFEGSQSDEIERRLFGPIDANGEKAVAFFSNYAFRKGAGKAFQDLMEYMDIQRLRTPKGLDLLRSNGAIKDHNQLLFAMQRIQHVHVTIWSEAVWEVVSCQNSATKFIVSDHPVATYNRRCFPGASRCQYPHDPAIDLVGTHTLFPLDLEHCLIITNLEYVRDLDADPMRGRANSRAFQPVQFDLRSVQTGRELVESDVLAINYIIKKRAARYVASAREEWLFPERHLVTTHWSRLGTPHFLMPDSRLVKFATGMYVRYQSGAVFSADEYGRIPDDNDPTVKRQRDREWKANLSSHKTFEGLRGPIAPEAYQRMI
jgi:hypothetical protein